MTTAADVLKLLKEKENQVRRSPVHRHQGQGTARDRPDTRRGRSVFRGRQGIRRLVDRRLEGHTGVRHDPDAGSVHRGRRPVLRGDRRSTCVATSSSLRTMQGYERDPRSLAKRAEAYLKSTGIADASMWGPENEFFIFDSIRHGSSMNGCFYEGGLRCRAHGTPAAQVDGGNLGHRPGVKGGYFPVPPVDARTRTCAPRCASRWKQLGLKVEVHHAEVATGGQAEINVSANTLVKKADEVQILKYAIHNVAAASYGKTATFMPKPLVGDNGNGMHVNQSLVEGRQEPVRGRQVRRHFRTRHLLHRRHHQARQGAQRHFEREHEQLQAARARLRGARDARVLGAQPLGVDPHSARDQPEGPAHRSAFPGLAPRIRTCASRPC